MNTRISAPRPERPVENLSVSGGNMSVTGRSAEKHIGGQLADPVNPHSRPEADDQRSPLPVEKQRATALIPV